jgi:uridylate kinase
MAQGYRRALLKISGEALSGDRGYGWDPAKTAWIAREIARAREAGSELGVVIGGGNIMRGVDAGDLGIPAIVGDQMGMVATVLNALALRSALEAAGVSARALSAFAVGHFVEGFSAAKAHESLDRGEVLVFAGGTGNPCFTTDSGAALRAVEIGADVLVKATQVRGVFDKDPRRYPEEAVLFETISPSEVIRQRLGVIDSSAVDILDRHGIPAIVLDLHEEGNIPRALSGEKVGTTIR